MAAREYPAKLADVKKVATSVKHFTFELEEKFDFKPGQFVIVEAGTGKEKVKRAYSIASLPGSRLVEIKVNIVPDGKMSIFLDRMKKGDAVNISGPYGEFGSGLDKHTGPITFIAAGTGISPIRCMLNTLIRKKFSKKIRLIYGFRHEEDYLFREELEGLVKKHRNIELITAISRPKRPEKWKGFIGRATDYLKKEEFEAGEDEFYICGVSEMAVEIKIMLLAKGVRKERIHTDYW